MVGRRATRALTRFFVNYEKELIMHFEIPFHIPNRVLHILVFVCCVLSVYHVCRTFQELKDLSMERTKLSDQGMLIFWECLLLTLFRGRHRDGCSRPPTSG